MKIGGSKRNRRRVFDLDVEVCWRGKDAVMTGRVGQGIPARRETLAGLVAGSQRSIVAYLTTSPTLTEPVWWRRSMVPGFQHATEQGYVLDFILERGARGIWRAVK